MCFEDGPGQISNSYSIADMSIRGTSISHTYFKASQTVSGHVSFGMILPAAKDLAQSSAFFGSAANILIPGRSAYIVLLSQSEQ